MNSVYAGARDYYKLENVKTRSMESGIRYYMVELFWPQNDNKNKSIMNICFLILLFQ